MSCLLEVGRLRQMGAGRQQLCASRLARERRSVQACEVELQAVSAQLQGLQGLLGQSQLLGRRLSRAELAGHLRQNAVLRRQAQGLELEITRLRQHRQALLDTCLGHQQQRLALSRKQQKYEQLERRLRHNLRLQQGRRDEALLEDLLLSRP